MQHQNLDKYSFHGPQYDTRMKTIMNGCFIKHTPQATLTYNKHSEIGIKSSDSIQHQNLDRYGFETKSISQNNLHGPKTDTHLEHIVNNCLVKKLYKATISFNKCPNISFKTIDLIPHQDLDKYRFEFGHIFQYSFSGSQYDNHLKTMLDNYFVKHAHKVTISYNKYFDEDFMSIDLIKHQNFDWYRPKTKHIFQDGFSGSCSNVNFKATVNCYFYKHIHKATISSKKCQSIGLKSIDLIKHRDLDRYSATFKRIFQDGFSKFSNNFGLEAIFIVVVYNKYPRLYFHRHDIQIILDLQQISTILSNICNLCTIMPMIYFSIELILPRINIMHTT